MAEVVIEARRGVPARRSDAESELGVGGPDRARERRVRVITEIDPDAMRLDRSLRFREQCAGVGERAERGLKHRIERERGRGLLGRPTQREIVRMRGSGHDANEEPRPHDDQTRSVCQRLPDE